uniref:Sucrose-phosphate synthase n=1 Tax=Xerophyta humilis TaxID=211604 RepID=D6R6Y6_9LILI|nr:sucrose phosphate synthase [Xerophyta humilis]
MAGNDWINSYLEAILDSGRIDGDKQSLLLRERGRFSPTAYFVEEVISGFDETDLYKSWVRAAATRSPQERNTRLENMCWRIWNLARKKKQIEGEEAQHSAKRRLEREKARREAAADMSEDLSEGEKGDHAGDASAHGDSHRGRMPRIGSAETFDAWANQQKEKKLYIVLISMHGLVRGENQELGRDSDTGGQVKYVVELARALGAMPGVYRVDLLTRQIQAPDVDWSYGEPTEMLPPRTDVLTPGESEEGLQVEGGESSGAYIVRIPFGPKDKYLHKELLWPYIQEFVDGALSHILQMSKVLGEQVGDGQPVWPAAIHGHYADAGDSAALLSGALNVPMVFTGHSLGRDKLEQLLKQGRQTRDEIYSTYKIMRRIEAEELALDASEVVITSTRQEIEEQWRLYDGFDPILERKLRVRIKRGVNCYGRFMPRMVVIAPGMEFNNIVVHDTDMEGEVDLEDNPASPDPPIWKKIMRFFTNPRKPMILALARPDPKKNLLTLVKAFGECRPLRELANLTLIMGNREEIDEMSSTNASVLTSVLKLIDKYDLYGQVAYPKHHKQSEVPDIYRLAAKTKGVFVNPAFIEPFGLTLLEAAAHGLPIVATKNGGPVDIHRALDNGLLIDPHNQEAIADALLRLDADRQLWARCRQNGLKNIPLFSGPEHCKTYLSRITSCRPRQPQWRRNEDGSEKSEPDSPSDSLRDIQDISLNLKFSLDGDKTEDASTLDSVDTATDGKNKLDRVVSKLSKGLDRGRHKAGPDEKNEQTGNSSKLPALRKRKHIVVIAVDSDSNEDLMATVKKIFDATEKDRASGSIGFVLSTALTIMEVHSALCSVDMPGTEFDAFICNSGSDLYYPSQNNEDNSSELPYVLDTDYHSQIEYRWGGEWLRKTLIRWAASVVNINDEGEAQVVTEDADRSSAYCHAFKVKNSSLVPPITELRKLMRIQALRCHVIYSHDGTKLHAIPVLASRSQALRYLYVRWGTELSNMVVFVGETGDTDYEGLLSGVHKSVILKGVCKSTSDRRFSSRNYSLSDVVAFDNPNILQIEPECKDIQSALNKLGMLKN